MYGVVTSDTTANGLQEREVMRELKIPLNCLIFLP